MASGLYKVEYKKEREGARLTMNVAADSEREAKDFVVGDNSTNGYVTNCQYIARIDEVAA